MAQTIITVSQLNAYIKAMLDGDPRLSELLVRGEISNFTNHRTGHFYMTLKDEKSLIRAVMFKSSASRLKFLPEHGMKVIVRGRVAVFERDGQYQLYLEDMQPDGIGALHVAFEQLKERLRKEGLFDESRKRPIPKLPSRIGVITSPTGAAVRDILNILKRRFPLARVRLYPVLVQGDGSPPQILEALSWFNENRGADVIILGRGGGSLEELWAFNDERVARAVAASYIPVVSAVGHETDFTISDFVSDLRAPTPSAAAELCVPSSAELSQRFLNLNARMSLLVHRGVERRRERLKLLSQKRVLQSPRYYIDDRRMTVEQLSRSISVRLSLILSNKRRELERRAAALHALSPLAVLSRGYAAVRHKGEIIRSVEQVAPGEELAVRVADGFIDARVTGIRREE